MNVIYRVALVLERVEQDDDGEDIDVEEDPDVSGTVADFSTRELAEQFINQLAELGAKMAEVI